MALGSSCVHQFKHFLRYESKMCLWFVCTMLLSGMPAWTEDVPQFWNESPLLEAQGEADLGQHGRSYAFLEAALAKDGNTWTKEKRQCVELAMVAGWMRTNPLARSEAALKAVEHIVKYAPAPSPGLTALRTLLSGDGAKAGQLLANLSEEALVPSETSAEKHAAAAIGQGVCLCMTGIRLDADEGLRVLDAIAEEAATPPEMKKLALYAGGMAAGMWKSWPKMQEFWEQLKTLDADYEPNPDVITGVLDCISASKMTLSSCPRDWNPAWTAVEIYVIPFARVMKAGNSVEVASAQCAKIVKQMGAEGSYQMGLYKMERGEYFAAAMSFQAYIPNALEGDRLNKALAYCAETGLRSMSGQGMAATGAAIIRAIDLFKLAEGDEGAVIKSLLSLSFDDAVPQMDALIEKASSSQDQAGRSKANRLRILKSLVVRCGVLQNVDELAVPYGELETVIKDTTEPDDCHQLAKYTATLFTKSIPPESPWREKYKALGKAREGFDPRPGVAEAVDELVNGNGFIVNTPEWRDFVYAIVEVADSQFEQKGFIERPATASAQDVTTSDQAPADH